MDKEIKKDNTTVVEKLIQLMEYPRISVLEECIKETVIGQDQLIRSIAISLYNAYYTDVPCIELIVGGPGTGKTLTMECFCKEMCLPYTIESATQYTQEGYQGESVNRMLLNLIRCAGYEIEEAQNGILIIDEIGKKTTKGRGGSDGRDVSGEGVLDSLLPILSGSPINITLNDREIQFETKNLKIFLMDACGGLEEIRQKRLGNKTFGFSADGTKESNCEQVDTNRVYTDEDLIQYGFTPEFVSRINKIHVTNPIDIDTLVRIQKESKQSIYKKYEKGLYNMGIKLEVYSGFFEEVAEAAIKYGTGARKLTDITKYVFEELMYKIYDSEEPINVAELREGITKDNTKFAIY